MPRVERLGNSPHIPNPTVAFACPFCLPGKPCAHPVRPYALCAADEATGRGLQGAVFCLENGATACRAMTDALGYARFSHLRPQAYRLCQLQPAPGYAPISAIFTAQVSAAGIITLAGEGAAGHLVLCAPLARRASFWARVADASTGALLPGAVYRLDAGGGAYAEVESAGEGILAFAHIAPGAYCLYQVRPPKGYALNPARHTLRVAQNGHAVIDAMPAQGHIFHAQRNL